MSTAKTTDQCKHGFKTEWCARCKRETPEGKAAESKKKRSVHEQTTQTEHGRNHTSKRVLSQAGMVVIPPLSEQDTGGKNEQVLRRLDDRTRVVHLRGQLSLWLIKEIIRRAPKIQRIQAIPRMKRMDKGSHSGYCREHGVELVYGHIRPELAWEEDRNISKHWEPQQLFLLGLAGEQKRLYEELKAFGFDIIEVVDRYFCLSGQSFLPQTMLAEEFGFCSHVKMSTDINAFLKYLDPQFQTSKDATRLATGIIRKVTKLRHAVQTEGGFQEYIRSFGLERIPAGIPLGRIELYATLIAIYATARGEHFKKSHPRLHAILEARFDLSSTTPTYRTLEEVGKEFDVTRERIRQLENKAFEELDIDPLAHEHGDRAYQKLVKRESKKTPKTSSGGKERPRHIPLPPKKRVGAKDVNQAVCTCFSLEHGRIRGDDLPAVAQQAQDICAFLLSNWCNLTDSTIGMFLGITPAKVTEARERVQTRKDGALFDHLEEIKRLM